MNRKSRPGDFARSAAALVGLATGLTLMWLMGLGGMLYMFAFGATGTVMGGMIGERLAGKAPRTGEP